MWLTINLKTFRLNSSKLVVFFVCFFVLFFIQVILNILTAALWALVSIKALGSTLALILPPIPFDDYAVCLFPLIINYCSIFYLLLSSM